LNEVKQIGNIVNTGNWDNPQRGRIYSADGICPALNTVGGGGLEPKIIEDFYKNREPRVYDETAPTIRAEREGLKVIVASRGRNPDNPSDRKQGIELEQRLEPNSEGICNTLTSVQKDNLVLEPSILTPKRTEYGKAIRKDYEKGKIQESRHNMTELQPREDGLSNTLTTVQKDNLVLEPNELQFIGGLGNKDRVGDGKELSRNFPQGERVYSSQGIGCSQTAQGGGTGSYTGLYLHNYRIRKLTPKECWRLMGFTDEDFCKAEKVNSNTQLYKQAGNSIVVEVLEGIFKQMF
jgi:DNA (cytosine-5)-methyltransferase 1